MRNVSQKRISKAQFFVGLDLYQFKANSAVSEEQLKSRGKSSFLDIFPCNPVISWFIRENHNSQFLSDLISDH